MAETELHFWVIVALAEMLREHFHTRQDVHVGGNVNLYYEQGNPDAKRAPDLLVVKGVGDAKRYRDSFLLWQENAAPCAVIEVTSRGTAEEDTGAKKELYERLGVREYFLFDPRSEYLPRQLMGYRLVKVAEGNGDNGVEVRQQYDELAPAADGILPSAELGLRLVPRGQELDLVNPLTGERLLPRPELTEQLARYRQLVDQTEQRADQAEQDREEALRQAEQASKQSAEDRRLREEALKQSQDAARRAELAEKERADLAEQADKERRLREELEAELRRLRAALTPPPPADPGE
jgi:Uma2 family endonuclease